MITTFEEGLAAVAGAGGDKVGELYQECAAEGLRLAFLLTGDRALAEDVFHEAFIRAAGRLASLRDPSAFRSYLHRTIANRVISRARRDGLEARFLRSERRYSRFVVTDATGAVDLRDQLKRALYRLPIRQRAVLVLRFYLDLSVEQTAQLLGCSAGAVKSLTSRGLMKLREEVKSDD